jgi:hypothetical protein
LLVLVMAFRSSEIGPVSSETPQPDPAMVDFLHDLGRDRRQRLFGYAALKEPRVSEGGVLVGGVGPRSASITVAWSQARIRVSSTATGGACRLASITPWTANQASGPTA